MATVTLKETFNNFAANGFADVTGMISMMNEAVSAIDRFAQPDNTSTSTTPFALFRNTKDAGPALGFNA